MDQDRFKLSISKRNDPGVSFALYLRITYSQGAARHRKVAVRWDNRDKARDKVTRWQGSKVTRWQGGKVTR